MRRSQRLHRYSNREKISINVSARDLEASNSYDFTFISFCRWPQLWLNRLRRTSTFFQFSAPENSGTNGGPSSEMVAVRGLFILLRLLGGEVDFIEDSFFRGLNT